MRNPNGPSVEQVDDWNDALLDQYIEEQQAKESKAVRAAKCAACKTAWVDVLNGEDTCDDCKGA